MLHFKTHKIPFNSSRFLYLALQNQNESLEYQNESYSANSEIPKEKESPNSAEESIDLDPFAALARQRKEKDRNSARRNSGKDPVNNLDLLFSNASLSGGDTVIMSPTVSSHGSITSSSSSSYGQLFGPNPNYPPPVYSANNSANNSNSNSHLSSMNSNSNLNSNSNSNSMNFGVPTLSNPYDNNLQQGNMLPAQPSPTQPPSSQTPFDPFAALLGNPNTTANNNNN